MPSERPRSSRTVRWRGNPSLASQPHFGLPRLMRRGRSLGIDHLVERFTHDQFRPESGRLAQCLVVGEVNPGAGEHLDSSWPGLAGMEPGTPLGLRHLFLQRQGSASGRDRERAGRHGRRRFSRRRDTGRPAAPLDVLCDAARRVRGPRTPGRSDLGRGVDFRENWRPLPCPDALRCATSWRACTRGTAKGPRARSRLRGTRPGPRRLGPRSSTTQLSPPSTLLPLSRRSAGRSRRRSPDPDLSEGSALSASVSREPSGHASAPGAQPYSEKTGQWSMAPDATGPRFLSVPSARPPAVQASQSAALIASFDSSGSVSSSGIAARSSMSVSPSVCSSPGMKPRFKEQGACRSVT